MIEKYRNDRHIAINVELSKDIANCVELEERESENGKITLPMLIKAAKRMNPDRIIVDLFELEKYYKVEESNNMNIKEILEKAKEITEIQNKIEKYKNITKILNTGSTKTIRIAYNDISNWLEELKIETTDELCKDIVKALEKQIEKQNNILNEIEGKNVVENK